jgi:hypothetical protein
MAAGVTDRLWEIEDLLALTDEFVIQRKLERLPEPEAIKPDPIDDTKPTHWVFHHLIQSSTKVHLSSCCNCRDGRGKKDGASKTGEWVPAHSLEQATEIAESVEPDRNSICNMCLGQARSLGYRHKVSSRQNPPTG